MMSTQLAGWSINTLVPAEAEQHRAGEALLKWPRAPTSDSPDEELIQHTRQVRAHAVKVNLDLSSEHGRALVEHPWVLPDRC